MIFQRRQSRHRDKEIEEKASLDRLEYMHNRQRLVKEIEGMEDK